MLNYLKFGSRSKWSFFGVRKIFWLKIYAEKSLWNEKLFLRKLLRIFFLQNQPIVSVLKQQHDRFFCLFVFRFKLCMSCSIIVELIHFVKVLSYYYLHFRCSQLWLVLLLNLVVNAFEDDYFILNGRMLREKKGNFSKVIHQKVSTFLKYVIDIFWKTFWHLLSNLHFLQSCQEN
jgi:hypothetical protein